MDEQKTMEDELAAFFKSTATPTETIELFSWEYLKNHPKLKSIIRKYFGEIGADLYLPDNRSFRIDNDSPTGIADNFVQEVDQIKPQELLDDTWPKTYDEAWKYIYNRPYYFLYTNGKQAQFIQLLLTEDILTAIPNDENEATYWKYAVDYIHSHNHRNFNLSGERLKNGEKALLFYTAKYVKDSLGKEKTQEVLKKFFDFENLSQNVGKIYEFVSEALSEPLSKNHFLEQSKPHFVGVGDFDKLLTEYHDVNLVFLELFKYPVWLELEDALHDKILEYILRDQLNDLSIQYYLNSYLMPQNYVKLFPVILHTLRTTNNFQTFYLAGDVLYEIEQNLPDDKVLCEWFSQKCCDTYRPIADDPQLLYIESMDFSRYGDDGRILEDSVGWLLCRDENNQKFERELQELAIRDFNEVKYDFIKHVQRQVFDIKHEKFSPNERIRAAFEEYDDETEAWRCVVYPSNIEETLVVLKYILNGNSELFSVLCGLELLLISTHADEVGEYILNYLVENFELLSKRLDADPCYIISMFTAACRGATRCNEVRPLEDFAAKCRSIKFASKEEKVRYTTEINDALLYTKEKIARHEMQRNDLAKNLRKHTEAIEKHLTEECRHDTQKWYVVRAKIIKECLAKERSK